MSGTDSSLCSRQTGAARNKLGGQSGCVGGFCEPHAQLLLLLYPPVMGRRFVRLG